MTAPPSSPWSDFRRHAHDLADFIADYHESIESRPVAAQISPGDLFRALPAHPPQDPEPWDAITADVRRLVMPAVTHWQHPAFFAYFPANASPPAILAEFLSAGLGINGFLWQTSPAITELEMRTLDWLGEMIGLPPAFLFGEAGAASPSTSGNTGGSVIHGTASEAVLTAMVAARHRALPSATDAAPRFIAYCSSQAHSSVVKAAMIAGVGRDNVRQIAVDASLAMRADDLAQQIRRDRAAGLLPFFVCATVGTTSTGAFDPLRPIAQAIDSTTHGAPRPWLHVDAAWAAAACVCPEHRAILEGVELTDSLCFNPHKWLLTNFDCSAFWTRDRAALTASLSITPEYLRNRASDAGVVIDYRDWQIPLGRRFRALKLWFVIRHYGVRGLQSHIRRHIELARLFESLARADARFEMPVPRSLALVVFRLRAGDDATRRLMERVNATGNAMLIHTVVPTGPAGARQFVIRMAIGAPSTEERHVRETWDLLRAEADAAIASP